MRLLIDPSIATAKVELRADKRNWEAKVSKDSGDESSDVECLLGGESVKKQL